MHRNGRDQQDRRLGCSKLVNFIVAKSAIEIVFFVNNSSFNSKYLIHSLGGVLMYVFIQFVKSPLSSPPNQYDDSNFLAITLIRFPFSDSIGSRSQKIKFFLLLFLFRTK